MEFLILVVEDDPDQLAIRSMLLRQHGFSVVEAGTAESALILAERQKPQCIVLDLRLPTAKDGLRLLSELKLADPQRQVYVFTGARFPASTALSELDACDGVFQKGTSILPMVDALTRLRHQMELNSYTPSA